MSETLDLYWKTSHHARQYDTSTRTVFARIYPVIADLIIDRTGITRGTCLDVGSGPAPLAIALALRSDLQIMALDTSPTMQSLMVQNIRALNLDTRIVPLLCDVHTIPIADETCDLVVSRGSYHFWNDLSTAIREIYRVLKPGGTAHIGGGYGSLKIKNDVLARRKEQGIMYDSGCSTNTRFSKVGVGEIESSLITAGIRDHRIINDDSGFWILFHK